MQCQLCRRKKFKNLYSYGGMLICFSCNEKHNPITGIIYKLTDYQRKALENKKIELESQLHKISVKLRRDDQMIAEGKTEIHYQTFRTPPTEY